ESVQDAGRAVGNSFENLWRRVSETRLKNRTRDEIVAWVIMGVLVGAVAGLFTSLKTTGLGKVGRLLLGLAGAFIGGMIVHVGRIDFGLGPVLIRYEELLFSLAGAVLLIIGARFFRFGAKKKPVSK
ncbi:MAG: GlsB/YeaQ/YmgE family stress response membrane protein, partial [Verrucomicrobia subdivision 3 bacterium]|nr:GlsB/YeaQ/YmgE family stress response membrane protein [Limisphaerales bacterium]